MHSKHTDTHTYTGIPEEFRFACAISSSFTLYVHDSQLPPNSSNVAGSCYDTYGFLCLSFRIRTRTAAAAKVLTDFHPQKMNANDHLFCMNALAAE